MLCSFLVTYLQSYDPDSVNERKSGFFSSGSSPTPCSSSPSQSPLVALHSPRHLKFLVQGPDRDISHFETVFPSRVFFLLPAGIPNYGLISFHFAFFVLASSSKRKTSALVPSHYSPLLEQMRCSFGHCNDLYLPKASFLLPGTSFFCGDLRTAVS